MEMKNWKSDMHSYRLCFVGVVVSNKFMIQATELHHISEAMKAVNAIKPTVPGTGARYDQYSIWIDNTHQMVFRYFPN